MAKTIDTLEPTGTGSEQQGWNEQRNLNPTDLRLRYHGYRIHSRRKGQEPEWESPPDADRTPEYPFRRIITQSVAMEECAAIERKNALRKGKA